MHVYHIFILFTILDGNLVLYRTSDFKPIWASGTNGKPATVLFFGSVSCYIDSIVFLSVIDQYLITLLGSQLFQ